jgi:uncharacterized damage-inducible protein DinB
MYTVQRHLDYNAWAAEKLVENIKAAIHLADVETPGSFNTIRKTLFHIWDAEAVWYTRIQGRSLTGWPGKDFKGTLEEAFEAYIAHSKSFAAFFYDKDNDFLNSALTYKNMSGKEFTQPIDELVYHVVNHAAYHRGQVVTMLRTLGHEDIIGMDLIIYLRTLH